VLALAWQIEFEPVGPTFEVANEKLSTLGLDPDGYGWATLIKHRARSLTRPAPQAAGRAPRSAERGR
jgi:hypothetical protein